MNKDYFQTSNDPFTIKFIKNSLEQIISLLILLSHSLLCIYLSIQDLALFSVSLSLVRFFLLLLLLFFLSMPIKTICFCSMFPSFFFFFFFLSISVWQI